MNCADETAAGVDEEVMALIKSSYAQAKQLLEENRHVMDKIAEYLVERETITGHEFMEIYCREKGIPMPEKEAGSEKPAVIDGTKGNEPEMTEDGKEIISVKRGRDSEGYHAKLGNPEQQAAAQTIPAQPQVSPETVAASLITAPAEQQSEGTPQPLGPLQTEPAAQEATPTEQPAEQNSEEGAEQKEENPFAAEFKKRAYKAPDDNE